MTPPIYELRGVSIELNGRAVLGPIDFSMEAGSFVAVVGPNGSGKTTLLRTLTGAVPASAGDILLHGRHLAIHRASEIARLVGVVPQTFTLDFSFTVGEMVAMGRYAHGSYRIRSVLPPVTAALEATGLTALADRPVTQLSGGERQRALIAQTLAQETPTLLLDEPLNNLDLNHQLETMQLLRRLHTEGRTVVVVLHDLNMAAQYCDELMVLDQGRVAARGTPAEVLDPALILETFKARVCVHRQGRRPYVTPVWSKPLDDCRPSERRRVHVVAGGGAAGGVIEELMMRGFIPSLGVVSVFDSDFATAQEYELESVSSPPFEPFTPEAIREFESLAMQAEAIIIAPVYFGRGNLGPLRSALAAIERGTKVIVIDQPPVSERDMSDGEATRLIERLSEAGAIMVSGPAEAVDAI